MSDKQCDTDVLIIGAGPSGAVTAHTLAGRGFKVVCLEQGDWVSATEFPSNRREFELLLHRKWSWNQNVRGRPEDYPLNVNDSAIVPIMFSAVGGSSVLFGAQWMRLQPSDFRVRSLDGICDDWPIDYWELEPYYNRVDKFLGVAGLSGDPAYPHIEYDMPPHPLGKGGMLAAAALNKLGWHWWPGSQAIPTANHKHLAKCQRWGVCETGCPAGAKASFDIGYWPHAISSGAKLITGARVRMITTDRAGRANGAVWIDRNGRETRQGAKAVVVAANGVGTPRLLLLSASPRFPDGLANSSGLVGKNLMLHPNSETIGLYDEPIESWTGPAGQLLYSLQFYETDQRRGFYRGSKINLMPVPGILRLLQSFGTLDFSRCWGKAGQEIISRGGRALAYSANIEDLPEETNAVTLDPDLKDGNGIPAPKVTYRLSENTRKSLAYSLERMVEMHETAGARFISQTPLWREQPGHLLGTARMGNDPRTSVVDRFGRAHDVPNLFIVDGSVMVTGGAVNPTSSITALALRTAEHIADTARDMQVAS
ncbi:MAG: GMC family oxidoreductase [Alphaproteobacteria bacterium]|nr:GMC family oxidoreductase [Alphaproteobacteria bacterium]